jgi:hypothetical protein
MICTTPLTGAPHKSSKEHGNAKMSQELNELFLFKEFVVLPLIT